MKMESRKELKDVGINMETGLERFVGNESLFIDFLKKFPDDSSYNKMAAELSKKSCEEAYKAAHTLKGVAGNLSLDRLHQRMIPLVEALRKGKLEEANSLYAAVKESYDEIVEALQHL